VGEVFVWALLAALNPTLLAATTVMLLLPHPKRLLLGYLLGALMCDGEERDSQRAGRRRGREAKEQGGPPAGSGR
jgi:hypothetical protein